MSELEPRCGFRWSGPRPEVRDSSVIHVCNRTEHDEAPHVCACTADSDTHRHNP